MKNTRRGINIGAPTSQKLGNLSASGIDHLMKERYGVKGFHRYCDDTMMLAHTKAEANFLLRTYNSLCAETGLVVKASAQICPILFIDQKQKDGRRRKRGKKRKQD